MSDCPACQTANPAGAKFCLECGTRLAAVPGPGSPVPGPGVSYTPKHLVEKVLKSRTALQGERKRVTVLFADIQGSTQVAEQAGAENWHMILEGFFEILTKAVHRYEGTVNQYTGDGVMALFGAPIAHEDHAQRACLAALAMQHEMERYQHDIQSRYRVTIAMRVGLNSGEVVVGRIGDDLRMDYTAQGVTVNLAQRMESLCAPGCITLTRNTSAQLHDRFRLRELGKQSVHGVSEPVEIFELECEVAWPSSSQIQLTQPQTRFIGRHAELAALEKAAARVAAGGKGELILLSGGAGVGKTRLSREFGRRCQEQGLGFVRSVCLPYARALPLWPVRRLLRQKLGITEKMPPDEGRRVAATALAALNSPLADSLRPRWLEFLEAAEDTQAVQTQGLGVRRRLLELVAAALLASNRPQVLLIEDLHWADVASEDFLQRLAGEIAGAKTLLLLNHRPDYDAHRWQPLAAETWRLAEFQGDDLQNLARDWLGAHASVQALARQVQERTGGNPFFLEEAVRDLEQSGYLRGARGGYQLARPVDHWKIPDTVHALLAARMDRLPAEQKTLLQTAAVLGQRFTIGLLAELSGAALYEVVDLVHLLEAAGFLRRPGNAVDGEFAVAHALMQEVAYQTMLESQRRTLHARLAECFELRHPATAAACEEWINIAHHWERAGEWARAGRWNMAAAQWASRWDLNVMLEQLRAAMANLDRAGAAPETVESRIAARSSLIRMAAHTALPGEEVERAYLEGRDLAKHSRDFEGHAKLVLSYGVHCLHRGECDRAAELATQAARLALAAERREAAESFVEVVLYIHNCAGRLEEGAALARELAGGDWAQGPVLARRYVARAEHATTLTYQGRLVTARRDLMDALRLAAEDDNTASRIHAALVDHAAFSGDTSEVMQHAQLALQRAEAFGSEQHKAWALRALGTAYCLTGQYASAVTLLEPARDLFGDRATGYIFQGVYRATLAESYRGSGRAALAAEAAENAITAARKACARIQELQAWTVFLSLPRQGHWAGRAPFGLARMEELIAFTGANAFMPWWCVCQARWASTPDARQQWQRQALDAFAQMDAAAHVKRLALTG